jgi:hypothetical protein
MTTEEAKQLTEQQRLQASAEYLGKAASQQLEAAHAYSEAVKDAENSIKSIASFVNPKDQNQAIQIIKNINNLLSEAKKGGDVSKIVAKLQALNIK